MRRSIEQRLGGDEEPGRAVAALRRPEVGEGLLERAGGPPSPGLRRSRPPAATLDAQHQARQHRTGPAARRTRRTRRARTRAWCHRGSDLSQHLEQRLACGSNATSCGSPLTVSAICVFCTVLQSSDDVVREHRGNHRARQRTVGTKPLDGPVERAEEGAGRHRRIGRRELAAPDARRNQRPDSTLARSRLATTAALNRPGRASSSKCTADPWIRSITQSTRGRSPARAAARRSAPRARRRVGRGLQPIEREVLARIENLVLAAEVVIEVGGGGRRRRRCRIRGREPHRAEDAGRGGEDFRPARSRAGSSGHSSNGCSKFEPLFDCARTAAWRQAARTAARRAHGL